MPQAYRAIITVLEPIDGGGNYPDQGLPGGGWGGPIDPGFGRPGGRPPHPGHLPSWGGGGRPVDPSWGVGGSPGHPDQGLPGGGGDHAGQLPIWPIDPERPSHGLPPVPGHELPPVDPPPGTIWPPLPPDLGIPNGKAIALVLITGVGYRYAVIDIDNQVDNSLPDEGEPPHPGQGLPPQRPGVPPRPGQGLPPGAATKPNPVPTPTGRR